MSLYNYVDTPNANLICCICRAPFTDPTTSLTCSHTFCGDCIARALSHSPTCPVDRTPLRPADLVPANPIVRSLVDELVVECVYRAEGCSYTAQRQVMPQHLRDACPFAEVTCEEIIHEDEARDEEDRLCNERIRRKDMQAHLRQHHGRELDDQGADAESPQEEAETEPEVVDEEYPIGKTSDKQSTSCPHAPLGCPYTGPLPPSQHLLSCPYESLKGFFSLNTAKNAADTAKIALLTEQNLVLRHKVDTLEGALQVLKKEMGAAKQALGPWFRSAYASATHNGAPRSLSSTNTGAGSPSPGSSSASTSSVATSGTIRRDTHAFQHEFRRSMSDGHPGVGMIPGGLDGPGIDDPVADRLASYFPTLPGTDIPAQHHQHQPPHPPNGTTAFIAPLDLSSPRGVEGTLAGLHASLGGLAAGVDALGRRSEMALANETLRMGEEMMSVRAQMHGLRMQVHGMMMDRNAAFGGFGGGSGAAAAGVGGVGVGVGAGVGGFMNAMNNMNGVGSPGVAGAPPREDGQFRMGMAFMGPPSITKL